MTPDSVVFWCASPIDGLQVILKVIKKRCIYACVYQHSSLVEHMSVLSLVPNYII